jgi:hypothetical protein
MNVKKPRRRIWRAVRGKHIPGILFEIDTATATVRFKRGRNVETVDLKKFGLEPPRDDGAIDNDG